MGWGGISQKRLAVFISHGEQGFLKTAQCAVLPCEVSAAHQVAPAVTENGVVLAPFERVERSTAVQCGQE